MTLAGKVPFFLRKPEYVAPRQKKTMTTNKQR